MTESMEQDLNDELITYFQSMEAHKHNQHYKKHCISSSMEVLIFAFKGSWEVKDWYHDDDFGETDVDRHLFPSLRRIGEGRLAKVSKAFLQRFQDLLNNSRFQTEVEKDVKEGKSIMSKVSAYRPFGTRVFCNRDESQQPVVNNPNAILQLLFYFLQLTSEHQNLADFALNSLAESLSYDEEQKNGLWWLNSVDLKNLKGHLLTHDRTARDAVCTSNKALFELSAEEKRCLRCGKSDHMITTIDREPYAL